MPISGGKYVAPTWANSTTPPIDADELQDICDSIEAYADPVSVIPTIPNPNLLDNWYFVGGGSQQGGGQFPINTRGQTVYSASGNVIDRWAIDGYVTQTLQSDCVELTKSDSASYRGMNQTTSSFESGIKLTLSVLFSGEGSGTARFTVNQGATTIVDQYPTLVSASQYQLYIAVFTVPSTGPITINLRPNQLTKMFVASAKLELGSTQTLAHQENGVWVLNEIPNYDIQYARCSELPSVPARYEYGTYVGTGTSGSSNPNSLTFGFVPKLVIIRRSSTDQYCLFAAINGCTGTRVDVSNNSGVILSWSGTTVSWYASSASLQLNGNEYTYYYTAIG